MKLIQTFSKWLKLVVKYAETFKKILSIGTWAVNVTKYAQEEWERLVKTELSDLLKSENEEFIEEVKETIQDFNED